MEGESLVGETVSHYRVLRKLGSGGMGVVYEAEDSRLGRRVAVKFLSDDIERDPAVLERFQREARAASALNHPGICTVHAIEEHEGQHFIVMELLEGQTLAQRIGHQPLALGELLDLGLQIADALEAAHAKGIVHRDLKPANIVVSPRGQIKILDFGLAKIERAARVSEETISESAASRQAGADLTVAGTVLGTVHYMSPEQARGQSTDARTDLFSFGAVLYQMATGALPFEGETQAVVFDAILNRDPRPLAEVNPAIPSGLEEIVEKALEKGRDLRYQTALDLKTDLVRLKRKVDSSANKAAMRSDTQNEMRKGAAKSIAVLYFENLSGAKEDEYFRDGITEDIITELSKIKGLSIFSRPTVLPFRDKQVTPAEIGRQIDAAYVLAGSLRRAGDRLRINVQLRDTRTDFPLWSERYDRELQDIFEVQDEIALKIAAALKITLTPQEQAEIAAKPTESLLAYDLYLQGRSYARRLLRQDSEFALQLFKNAVALDPGFAQGHAAIANVYARFHYMYGRDAASLERAREAMERALALSPQLDEARVAQAAIFYATGELEEAIKTARGVVERRPDCEGAYYQLLRALFGAGRYEEIAELAEAAIEASGDDYNVYVPIGNALGALGRADAGLAMRRRRLAALERHLLQVPEDARARILLASDYAAESRTEDALRELQLAMVLRPNEPTVLYNAACAFCSLKMKVEALDALSKAWQAGYRDTKWARRDPDLVLLRGDSEFERLFPEKGSDE